MFANKLRSVSLKLVHSSRIGVASNRRFASTPNSTVPTTKGSRRWLPLAATGLVALGAASYMAFAEESEKLSTREDRFSALMQDASTLKADQRSSSSSSSGATNIKNWASVVLKSIRPVSRDTKVYTFELGSKDAMLNMPLGSTLVIRAMVDGEEVIREYTPISAPNQRGTFDLMIKDVPTGKITKYLQGLKPGQSIEIGGPVRKYDWHPNMGKVAFLAGGADGIAPAYQLIKYLATHPEDHTELRLIYANETQQDVLLRDELDTLQASIPNFKVFYVLEKPTAQFEGGGGYISEELLKRALDLDPSSQSQDTFVVVSGPPPMMRAMTGGEHAGVENQQLSELGGLLGKMGFDRDHVYRL